VAKVDTRCLDQQASLGLQLHAAHEEIASVAHVRADGALQSRCEPESEDHDEQVAEVQRLHPRLRDLVDEDGAEVHGDRRHRGAEHPEDRVADERLRRRRPRELEAESEVLPDATEPALRFRFYGD